MAVTPQQVQKLREITGAGILDCKAALENTGADVEKAIQFLREKGKASAAKKSARSASEGLVCCWISPDGKRGSLVELNCETDFVARTKEFQEMVRDFASVAGKNSVKSADALKTQNMNGSKDTIDSLLKEKIGKLGENMVIKKVASMGSEQSFVSYYIHSPCQEVAECGKLGVLLEMKTDKTSPELAELAKEICMQIAAANPKWIKKEDVPSDIIEKEKAIYLEQCKQSGKPEASWPKILEGKLKDFLRQFCLLDQSHVRDSSGKTSVQMVIDAALKKAGYTASVQNFVRFKIGEE